jgi:uncharacterized damage-inducible protein DinB
MENKVNLTNLINLLNAGFHGGAWHGPSLLELTKGIKVKEAAFKAGNIHTIAELVYHITSWRLFALKKIQGDAVYNIDNEKMNFGEIQKVDEFELETLMMELTLSQDELTRALESKDDAFLLEIVPGAEYTYDTLLHGIIQHDIYHTGQIAIIKKLAAKSSKFEDDPLISGRFYDRDNLSSDFY